MAILKQIVMWVLEFFISKAIKQARETKAKNDRLEDSKQAREALDKARKEGADEQTIIELEEDMLNGNRPSRPNGR